MRLIRSPKTIIATVVVAAALAAVAYLAWPASAPPVKENSIGAAGSSKSKETAAAGFNKTLYSLTEPSSLWVIVNKPHPLQPIDYMPSDLVVPNVPLRVPGNESMQMRKTAAQALETMFAAAKTENLQLQLSSGYRSYTYQQGTYSSYVKQSGQAYADSISARPGHSEHQTGLAADIEPVSRKCEIVDCFADTPEGKWLAANAYKYGFIMRYPADKVSVTGYDYEPWHFRYVGTYLSGKMHSQGVETLEEFFGVSGGGY